MPFSSHNPTKVLEFVNLAKKLETKRLEVVEYKNLFDVNADPFETCVRRVKITCCENAHKCTKKRTCLGEFGFIV
jgi:hypothetical protein